MCSKNKSIFFKIEKTPSIFFSFFRFLSNMKSCEDDHWKFEVHQAIKVGFLSYETNKL